MKLLALDFDGVISDSAPESFAVALRTYAQLRPESRLCALAEPLAGGGAPTPESVAGHPLYTGFLERMPLGNRAEDYGVVLGALDAGVEMPDQAAYDVFRAGQDDAWLADFHALFYRVRHALADADPQGWRALMGPYAPLLELLRRRAADAILAIATAKDRRSVRALLETYGADDLFPDECVLDKEAGVTKTAHLQHLHERFGIELPEITFVDDKVNHLDSVAPLGVRCALAAWGYNGPREEALARQRGYLVCRLDDAETQLYGKQAD